MQEAAWRDGIPVDRLGLGLAQRPLRAAPAGTVLAVAHLLFLLACLRVVAPFDVKDGPLPLTSVALAGAG